MEQALCDVLKDVRIGKILIQTNRQTDEPEVGIIAVIQIIALRFRHLINKLLFSVILLEITKRYQRL